MGGYVTDTRITPGHMESDRFSQHVELYTGNEATYQVFPDPSGSHSGRYIRPQQVTTSYRSRGGEMEDLLGLGGSNWASRTKAIASYNAHRRTDHDSGHTFDTTKQSFTPITYGLVRRLGSYWINIQGPIMPQSFGSQSYPVIPEDRSSLETLGTYGINRTIPTNSPADLAQALIELKREGLPGLIGQQFLSGSKSRRSSAGSEYLNLEFGIKPILRDVQSTLAAVRNSSEILAKYQKEAGRKLHRQYTFPTVVSETSRKIAGYYISNYPYNLRIGYGNSGKGTLTETVRTTVRTWFHGAWSYYLQDGNTELNKLHDFAKQAEYLLGLEITPELLWEVSPWSWLSDWFFNIGVNISNAEALRSDGLVLRYGYVMRETRVQRIHQLDGLVPLSGTGNPTSCTAVYETIRKQRIRATPYGFGLNPATFSGRQWAILGALGLTRGNNSIRYSE